MGSTFTTHDFTEAASVYFFPFNLNGEPKVSDGIGTRLQLFKLEDKSTRTNALNLKNLSVYVYRVNVIYSFHDGVSSFYFGDPKFIV